MGSDVVALFGKRTWQFGVKRVKHRCRGLRRECEIGGDNVLYLFGALAQQELFVARGPRALAHEIATQAKHGFQLPVRGDLGVVAVPARVVRGGVIG